MTGIRLAGFILALGLSGSAFAVPITWVFEGQIRAIEDASPATLATLSSLGVDEGSAFSGRLVFESSTPDTDPDPTWGHYPIVTLEFTMGFYHPSLPPVPDFAYIDVATGFTGSYNIIQALGGGNADSLFTDPVLTFALRHDGAPIWDDALPLVPPELADLSPFILGGAPMGAGTGIVVYGSDGNIFGDLTMIEVPEPSVLLALLAPLAFALRRR